MLSLTFFFIGRAPWKWSAWKDYTGICHGLFLPDDAQLPPGLTCKDILDIASYFCTYKREKTEDDKIAFATKTRGNTTHPGHAKWNVFISWNWSCWVIHGLIIAELKDWDIHLQDIFAQERGTAWPNADTYIPMVLDTLGMKLFGNDTFSNGSTSLLTDLQLLLRIFM